MSMMILDGGMGQELVARAGRATSLWSVQSLIDAPEIVRQVHDDFFAAGAEIATTNTYSLLPERLEPAGLGDRLEEFTRRACQLAYDAREAHGKGLVAGGFGPLGFSYQPDKCPPAAEAAEIYAPLARIIAEYSDVLLLETMSSIDQARGGMMGAGVTDKPIWLALSVKDDDGTQLRSGEALADIAPLIKEFGPTAVLINCSKPEAVSTAMPIIAQHADVVGGYANGFTEIAKGFDKVGATVDLLSAREDMGPEAYADFAQDWASNGATLIGGCCEVGPAHIAALARRLKS